MFSENEKISMRQLKRNQLLLLLNLGILLVPLCGNGGSAAAALLAILLLAVFVLWSVWVEHRRKVPLFACRGAFTSGSWGP